jgi:hypothetical protein
MVSVTERDGPTLQHRAVTGHPLAPFADALCEAGLTVETPRLATTTDVDTLGSSWARRLGIAARRDAWLLCAYSMRNTG